MTFKQGPSAAWVDTGTVWSPAVDLTDRQEEIISFISGMPCHILGSEKIWVLLENTRKDSYFLHFYGNM